MSTQATLAALVLFSFVSSVTPGPNNMMLMASGVNFGFRRTIPHMLGIAAGFTVMTGLIGLGLGQAFARFPLIYALLKYAGAAYMLWLAWKIANSSPLGEGTSRSRPMTFLEAAAFQWINPKAWMMAVTAVATYVLSDNLMLNAVIVAVAFGVINLPCVSSWALFGVALRRWLQNPRWLRLFNWTMAAGLVISLWPVLTDTAR